MSWLSDLSKTPPLAIIVLGVLCVLAGSAGKLDYNQAHYAVGGDWQILVVTLGVTLVILGGWLLAAGTNDPPKQASEVPIPVDVPAILQQPLSVRLGSLSNNQISILNFIRDHEGPDRAGVRQEELEKTFNAIGGPYWRLEVLYLMGFINKRPSGRSGAYMMSIYSISEAYRTMFLERGIVPGSATPSTSRKT